ncbi:hypothetical protein EG329_004829 [Mollisiaceae sp. DMI_Dod_QoI]|nr:hypothetical protein EG329_004829 [Helotiales sp. DMI_Dod_QoI]
MTTAHRGHEQLTVSTMGLATTPSFFQHRMEDLFGNYNDGQPMYEGVKLKPSDVGYFDGITPPPHVFCKRIITLADMYGERSGL